MHSVMEYIMKMMQKRQQTLVIIVSSVDLAPASQDLVSKMFQREGQWARKESKHYDVWTDQLVWQWA